MDLLKELLDEIKAVKTTALAPPEVDPPEGAPIAGKLPDYYIPLWAIILRRREAVNTIYFKEILTKKPQEVSQEEADGMVSRWDQAANRYLFAYDLFVHALRQEFSDYRDASMFRVCKEFMVAAVPWSPLVLPRRQEGVPFVPVPFMPTHYV